tara:strand:+ start:120 stop:437 length:318 start_codon:yes stop_codon:yes gene_type:complete
MKEKNDLPSDPLLIDEDGLYITLSQMQFWLNDRGNRKLFREANAKFFKFYDACRAYNMISDMIVEDVDCAYLYWDEKRGVPAFSFPVKGSVTEAFIELGLLEDID